MGQHLGCDALMRVRVGGGEGERERDCQWVGKVVSADKTVGLMERTGDPQSLQKLHNLCTSPTISVEGVCSPLQSARVLSDHLSEEWRKRGRSRVQRAEFVWFLVAPCLSQYISRRNLPKQSSERPH